MFQLNNDADVNGTCRQSEIMAAPTRLIELFGQPIECDGYKVSGEYVFENSAGDVFTLYDWKYTTLYCQYGMSPEAFWSQTTPVQFNIGGRGSASSFVQWLQNKL